MNNKYNNLHLTFRTEARIMMLDKEIIIPVEFEYDYQPFEPRVIHPVDMSYEGSEEYMSLVAINLISQNYEGDNETKIDIIEMFSEDELDEYSSQIMDILNND